MEKKTFRAHPTHPGPFLALFWQLSFKQEVVAERAAGTGRGSWRGAKSGRFLGNLALPTHFLYYL